MSASGDARLMAIGDVHLGTRPGSLPSGLEEWGLEVHALTPETALTQAVERAIEERVHAVLFAGDVVESTNARFEALRPLEEAVQRLRTEGIPALAVVGNHDVEALPRLAQRIEGLELIGAGGSWQGRVIEVQGRPAVEVVGWSFPERQVRSSPVAELVRAPLEPQQPGIPRLGLLHGDMNASGGTYAPFSRGELVEAGLDAWLLGHIHKPSLGRSAATGTEMLHGYLGSLLGLNPKETGPHGPWLVRVGADGSIQAEQLAIAPLRWERVDLKVDPAQDCDDLGDRLLDEAERVARALAEQGHAPRALGLRVRLVGPTQHFDSIREHSESGQWEGLMRAVADTLVFIDRVDHGLELALDLEQLASGDDPPALLARKLLCLGGAGEERADLLARARAQLRAVAEESCWSPLDELRDREDPLSDELLCAALQRSGTSALHALLAQRPGGEGAGGATP